MGRQAMGGDPSDEFVFIGDADNLAHYGEKRGSLNVLAFSRLLRERGISASKMVGNHFSPMEEKLWMAAGFECVSTHCNADDEIKSVIRGVVRAGAKRICLGSGDHTFASLVSELKEQGVQVHVLARRNALSPKLRDAATGYAWTDKFLAKAA